MDFDPKEVGSRGSRQCYSFRKKKTKTENQTLSSMGLSSFKNCKGDFKLWGHIRVKFLGSGKSSHLEPLRMHLETGKGQMFPKVELSRADLGRSEVEYKQIRFTYCSQSIIYKVGSNF